MSNVKKYIELPNADVTSFIPVPDGLYFNNNYTVNRFIRMVDADIESQLKLKLNEYITFRLYAEDKGWEFSRSINIIVNDPAVVPPMVKNYNDRIIRNVNEIALIKRSNTAPMYAWAPTSFF